MAHMQQIKKPTPIRDDCHVTGVSNVIISVTVLLSDFIKIRAQCPPKRATYLKGREPDVKLLCPVIQVLKIGVTAAAVLHEYNPKLA